MFNLRRLSQVFISHVGRPQFPALLNGRKVDHEETLSLGHKDIITLGDRQFRCVSCLPTTTCSDCALVTC
jgi:hypothetical protein